MMSMNLLVFVLLGISAITSYQPSSMSTNKSTGIIFDLTQQLKAFRQGNVSKEDLKRTVNSGTCPHVSEVKDRFYYNIENSSNINAHAIKQVFQVLNDITKTTGSFQLTISMPFDNFTISNDRAVDVDNIQLNQNYLYNKDSQLNIVIDLNIDMICDDDIDDWKKWLKLDFLRNTLDISEIHSMRLGISLNSSKVDLNCTENILSKLKESDVTFIVYNDELQDKTDLEDSLNYLIKDVVPRLQEMFPLKQVIYNPNLDEIDESNCRLLSLFSELYEINIIFRIPDLVSKTIKPQDFIVIPHLSSDSFRPIDSFRYKNIWTKMLSFVVDAVSKGFQTFVVTPSQWMLLNSLELKALYTKMQHNGDKNSLRIIVDYSAEKENDWCRNYAGNLPSLGHKRWGNINSIFENTTSIGNSKDMDSIALEARIFGFLGNSSTGFRTKVLATFNLDILSKLRIGCSIKATSIVALNATKAVEACRVINGTLYILKWDIILKITGNSTKYIFKEFEAIEKIRNEILNEEPEAIVYIQVKISELEFENSGINMGHIVRMLKNPLFCHQEITHLKRILAGIITFANAYNFPVIINSEIPERGCSHAEDTEWVSFLKKIPHFKNGNTQTALRSPYDLEEYRYSFPIAAQQYMTDACINWADGDSEIPADYFHNNYLGAIFYPDDVHNQTALENVLATMLQFVFHRFHSLEIVCSSNFASVYQAIKLVFELESNLIRNSSVFVSFFSSVNETLTNLTFFENFLDEFEVKGFSAIHGIHVELQEHSKKDNWHWFEDGIAPLDLSAYIKLQTIFENKFRQKNRAIKFGIVVNIRRYFELIQAIINPDAVHQEYVNQINSIDHIVFVDEFYVGYSNQIHYLQRMFDDHLNYKRVIQKLIPDVEVYFRVEVSIELTADPKVMDDYRRILAHFEIFSKTYNFRYFLVNAFDNQMGRKNGWWEIKNHSDLTEVQAYVEKETVYFGRSMWYPPKMATKDGTVLVYETPVWFTVGLVLLSIFLAVASVFIIRLKKRNKHLSEDEANDFWNGKDDIDAIATNFGVAFMNFDSKFELKMSQMSVDTGHVLGTGNFGTVYKGIVNGEPAAIKQPHANCLQSTFKTFLCEVKVLCCVGEHPNVLLFLGAYTKEIRQGSLMIATEFCSNGSLEKLLRVKKSVASQQEACRFERHQLDNSLYYYDLHRFSKQIAAGMEYIESKHIVHGDLSTRNVLLNENFTCKIGDFGLSRKLHKYEKYVKKSQDPLPWKWMAYESLANMEFTSKSDVWSYGVTLWEIYSFGNIPYGGLNWSVKFPDELKNGLRLSIPHYASENIYKNMEACWCLNPEERPTFSNLVTTFNALCEDEYQVI